MWKVTSVVSDQQNEDSTFCKLFAESQNFLAIVFLSSIWGLSLIHVELIRYISPFRFRHYPKSSNPQTPNPNYKHSHPKSPSQKPKHKPKTLINNGVVAKCRVVKYLHTDKNANNFWYHCRHFCMFHILLNIEWYDKFYNLHYWDIVLLAIVYPYVIQTAAQNA